MAVAALLLVSCAHQSQMLGGEKNETVEQLNADGGKESDGEVGTEMPASGREGSEPAVKIVPPPGGLRDPDIFDLPEL